MSDEEDNELLALRSAALASINKARQPVKEVDDLDSLRQAALQSRKPVEDEESNVFVKLQPPKSSNLINLTPAPEIETPAGGKASDKFDRLNSKTSGGDASDISESSEEESSSSDSSDGSDDESEAESNSSADKSKEEEEKTGTAPKNEDDDILNAIDMFLGGDLIDIPVIEKKAEPAKRVAEKQKKVKQKKEKKRKKENAINKVVKKETRKTATLQSPETKQAVEVKKNAVVRDKSPIIFKEEQNTMPLKPLVAPGSRKPRRTRNNSGDNDSVHSSDLSFLGDSSGDEKKNATRAGHDPDVLRVNITSVKPERRKPENSKSSTVISLTKKSERPKREEAPTQKGGLDLRDKLRLRGFRRKIENDRATTNRQDPPRGAGKTNYVKPSPVPLTSRNHMENEVRVDDAERIVVTRNVTDRKFADKSITLTPKKSNSAKSISLKEEEKVSRRRKNSAENQEKVKTNRKRSVLHFDPDTPTSERREKIEKLMKSAPKIQERRRSRRKSEKNEKEQEESERSFSDLSEQDFDAFEIADDFDTEVVPDAEPTINKEQAPPLRNSNIRADTRRFVTSSRKSSSSSSSTSSSSSGELSDTPPPQEDKNIQRETIEAPQKEPLRRRIGGPPTSEDSLPYRKTIRPLMEVPLPSRRQHSAEDRNDPPPTKRKRVRDRLGVKMERPKEAAEDGRRRKSRNTSRRRGPPEEDFNPSKTDAGTNEAVEDADSDENSIRQRSAVSSSVTMGARVLPASSDPLPGNERPQKSRRKVGITLRTIKSSEGIPQESVVVIRKVKERLGKSSSSEVRKKRKKSKDAGDLPSPKRSNDRERELDERMKKIREKNAAILRRRQEIEMEEKRFG